MSVVNEQDWPFVSLDEVGEVNRGRSRHRPRYAEHLYGGPYPFIQTGDIKQSGGRITEYEQTYSEAGLAQSRLWPEGTMCITIAANIAETAILTFPACFPDSVVGFIADESKCDVRFIEYTFRNLKRRIQHEATGSVQDNINLGTLQRLKFQLPTLPEQRAIASILGALDDKIELNRRMNATLESLARAIFKSWFVDFDPVHVNAGLSLTGQMPKSGAIPTMHDPKVLELFPSTFQDSKMGLIPEGWTVRRMEDIAIKVATGPFGSRITKKNFVENGVPVIRGNNLTDGFNEDEFAYLTEAKADDLKTANVFPGDIVFTHRGTLGQVGLIPESASHPRYVVSQSQMYLRVDPQIVSPKLVYLFFRNPVGQHALLANKSQVGVPAIARPTTSLKAIRMVIPPSEVSDAFVAFTKQLYEQFHLNNKESAELASTRDALLPQLLSGKIEAPLDAIGASAE